MPIKKLLLGDKRAEEVFKSWMSRQPERFKAQLLCMNEKRALDEILSKVDENLFELRKKRMKIANTLKGYDRLEEFSGEMERKRRYFNLKNASGLSYDQRRALRKTSMDKMAERFSELQDEIQGLADFKAAVSRKLAAVKSISESFRI